jgi:hypothetical protein
MNFKKAILAMILFFIVFLNLLMPGYCFSILKYNFSLTLIFDDIKHSFCGQCEKPENLTGETIELYKFVYSYDSYEKKTLKREDLIINIYRETFEYFTIKKNTNISGLEYGYMDICYGGKIINFSLDKKYKKLIFSLLNLTKMYDKHKYHESFFEEGNISISFYNSKGDKIAGFTGNYLPHNIYIILKEIFQKLGIDMVYKKKEFKIYDKKN